MTIENTPQCPCNSGKTLSHCCGPYHEGKIEAPTAEALMRSRYAAFVLGLSDYIWHTWHPDTRPDLKILGGLGLKWIDLQIFECTSGLKSDHAGKVRFVASFISGNKCKQLDENSDFVKENGSWFYVDGESKTLDLSRNSSCPCGSGKKLKRCCQH